MPEEKDKEKLEKRLIRAEKRLKQLRPSLIRRVCYALVPTLIGATAVYCGLTSLKLKQELKQATAPENFVEKEEYNSLKERAEEVSAQLTAKDTEAKEISAQLSAKEAKAKELSAQLSVKDEEINGISAQIEKHKVEAEQARQTQEKLGQQKQLLTKYESLLGQYLCLLGDEKKGEERIQLYEQAMPHLEKVVKERGNPNDKYWLDRTKSNLEKAKKGFPATEYEEPATTVEEPESSLDEEVEQGHLIPAPEYTSDLELDESESEEGISDEQEFGYFLFIGGVKETGVGSFGIEGGFDFGRGGFGFGMAAYSNLDIADYYVAGGFPLNDNLNLTVTIGFSIEEFSQEYFTCSAQLRYIHKWLIIGAGYHNRRGFVGGIGFVID